MDLYNASGYVYQEVDRGDVTLAAGNHTLKFQISAQGAGGGWKLAFDYFKLTAITDNTNGLVGWWKFNEAAGVTTATDAMGADNNGALQNGLSSAGVGYLTFDGAASSGDDLINAGSASNLDNLPAFTLSAWIKPDSMGEGGFGRIFDKGAAGFRLLVRGTNQLSCTVNYATTELNRISAANTVALGAWQHVAVTWTGSSTATNLRIYVNGVEAAYSGSPIDGQGARGIDATANLILGNDAGGARTFDGTLDDLRVYNRVLSADEITKLNINGPQ